MESTSSSTPSPSVPTVKEQLSALDTTSTADLKKMFADYFGFAPNVGHPEFLRKQLAWKIQERAYGGYSPRALARIEELLAGMPGVLRYRAPRKDRKSFDLVPPSMATAKRERDPRIPPVGTVMRKVHHGVEHAVTVQPDGFEYAGELYRSLTGVAKKIANCHWNGFLYFQEFLLHPKQTRK